jgi:hypothetical protein
MTIPHLTHRRVPWDAGDRLPTRSRGASYPRVSGRERDVSPSLLPVACVVMLDVSRRPACG